MKKAGSFKSEAPMLTRRQQMPILVPSVANNSIRSAARRLTLVRIAEGVAAAGEERFLPPKVCGSKTDVVLFSDRWVSLWNDLLWYKYPFRPSAAHRRNPCFCSTPRSDIGDEPFASVSGDCLHRRKRGGHSLE
jgi:hypothetical protein